MDAPQKHAERIASPAALADRFGQIIFRLETNLGFIGRGPMDAPVREAMRSMQSDLERLRKMKDVLLAQIET
jgi:hypothetical protein